MPRSPSSPIAGASSRVGNVPCSYHSSTFGSTRSPANRRTVSAMSRSSSESRPSRSSGSSGRTLGRVAVADMRPSVDHRRECPRPNRAKTDLSENRAVESVRANMAVDTTVQVTLPQMGESVTEGTVLEWRKQEGDRVEADEVLVEVSTDKVDAEVPAPTSGTVTKIHAAEGDTVQVGGVLAEIATGNGAAPAAAQGNGSASSEPAEAGTTPTADAEPSDGAGDGATATGATIDIVTPSAGESVTEGTLVAWHVAAGDQVGDGQAVADISTDKIDVELPAPAAGTITEIVADEGDTVTVGQVIARMTTGNGASAAATDAPARTAPPEPAGAGNGAHAAPAAPALPEDARVSPVAARIAAAEGIDLARVDGTGPH